MLSVPQQQVFPSPPSLPPSRGLLFTNVHVPPCLPPVSRPSPPHDARISSTPRPRSGNGTGRPHRYSSCLPRNHYTERASERGAFCNIRHGGRQRSRSTRGGAWAGWLAARTCNASRKTLRFRFKNTTQKCTCARPSERGFERPASSFPTSFQIRQWIVLLAQGDRYRHRKPDGSVRKSALSYYLPEDATAT